MKLSRDFSEFVTRCVDRDVRFLIVGGFAVAAHGHPRFTKDLDVWIWVDPDNAQRLVQALTDVRFGSVGLDQADFLEPEVVVQLGYPPNRIDLLTSIDGVDFMDRYDDRLVIELDGVAAPFIDLEHLKLNKRASGRHQDLADPKRLNGRRTDDSLGGSLGCFVAWDAPRVRPASRR